MKNATLVAIVAAATVHVVVAANDSPQVGPNNNVVAGVLTTVPTGQPDLNLARIKADILPQRQNESVIAASTRNPDHLLAAANDYRTVEIHDDAGIGEADNSFIARLLARVFGWTRRRGVPKDAAAAEAWMGIYRSCDRGRSWIGSLLPGSPNDTSPASMTSPLKGFEAATDPVLAPLPHGRVVVGGLAFTRNGPSRIFSAIYEDRNKREGGACWDFVKNSIKTIADGARSSTGAFADKPAIASDVRNGNEYVYLSYTVFDGTQHDGRVRSKLMIARSWDGGVTWKSVTPKINRSFLRSQGTAIAVDPLSGHVYVVWRLFYDDVMMLVKSTDFGVTWSSPTTITLTQLQTFDQGTGIAPDYGFRSNAFPTIAAAVVNNQTKLFAAWQERVDTNPQSDTYGQPKAGGSPRIVLTTSANGGASWTARKAIDLDSRAEDQPAESQPAVQHAGFPSGMRPSGPQVMPWLTASGGRVMLLYYEARWLPDGTELGGPLPGYITGLERQMDARVAEINPQFGVPGQNPLVAPSAQVSRYAIEPGSAQSAADFVETVSGYSAVNRPNLPMYRAGTAAFVGDYITIAPANPYVTGSAWRWPTDADLPSPSFHTVFNDNRMVGYPLNDNGVPAIDGHWESFKAATSDGTSACDNPLSRNADIFHAEVGGLVAGSPQTFKQLGFVSGFGDRLMPRAFVMYVENRTGTPMIVRLTIEDNEPAVDASFKQFDLPDFVDIETKEFEVLPHSNVTRTVYARSEGASASFRVRVEELDSFGGSASGRRTFVRFNPDPSNEFLELPAVDSKGNPIANINTHETHAPQIDSPQIDSVGKYNPQIDSPQIDSQSVKVPQIDSPQIDSPQIDSAQLSSDELSATAYGGTRVVWKVRNKGNTTTAYNSFMNVPNVQALLNAGWQFQVIIATTTYTPGVAGCQNAALAQTRVVSNIAITSSNGQTPQIDSPQIDSTSNPQIDSPQIDSSSISNASIALAPEVGVEGQNSHGDDLHSPVLAQEAIFVLNAIRVQETVTQQFDPDTVALMVVSQPFDVADGLPVGNSPPSAFSGPDLVITSGPTLSASTVVIGDEVAVGSVTVANQGTRPAGPYATAHFLSSTPSPEGGMPLADPFDDPGNNGLAAGASESISGFTATISPESAGTYYVVVEADHGNAVAEANNFNNVVSMPIQVVPPPSIVTTTLPDGALGTAYPATTLSATDGIPGYTWTFSPANGLPPGLTLSSAGVITGTPTTAGLFSFVVQAADAGGHIATRYLSILVPGSSHAFNTDYKSAGFGGLRGVGSDATGVTLSGIPAGARIAKALLYWHGPTNSTDPHANATVTFGGTSVTGTQIGFAYDNNWNMTNSQAYRADVTTVVRTTGNGSYALANFRKAGPPLVEINGVSLLVFYNDSDDANNRDVYLFDGNDSNVAFGSDPANWSRQMSGITYSSGSATIELHVSDGQSAIETRTYDDGELVLAQGAGNATLQASGNIFAGDTVPNGGSSNVSNGGLWDIKSYAIPSSLLFSGSNTLTLTSPFVDDRLSLIVSVVHVPHVLPPPIITSSERPDSRTVGATRRPVTVPAAGSGDRHR